MGRRGVGGREYYLCTSYVGCHDSRAAAAAAANRSLRSVPAGRTLIPSAEPVPSVVSDENNNGESVTYKLCVIRTVYAQQRPVLIRVCTVRREKQLKRRAPRTQATERNLNNKFRPAAAAADSDRKRKPPATARRSDRAAQPTEHVGHCRRHVTNTVGFEKPKPNCPCFGSVPAASRSCGQTSNGSSGQKRS